jgi:hypothetical protein
MSRIRVRRLGAEELLPDAMVDMFVVCVVDEVCRCHVSFEYRTVLLS